MSNLIHLTIFYACIIFFYIPTFWQNIFFLIFATKAVSKLEGPKHFSGAPFLVFSYSWQLRKRHQNRSPWNFLGPSFFVMALVIYLILFVQLLFCVSFFYFYFCLVFLLQLFLFVKCFSFQCFLVFFLF